MIKYIGLVIIIISNLIIYSLYGFEYTVVLLLCGIFWAIPNDNK